MFKNSLTKRLFAVGVLIGGVLVGAVAWAAWTAGGTGNSTARAISAVPLTTVDATASTTATLFPGATGSTRITITNPNPYPVRVTSVTGNGSITSDKGAACNAATGVTYLDQTGLALDIAAGSSASFTLGGSVTMNNTSDNSCQAAVFTIPVTLAGASNA